MECRSVKTRSNDLRLSDRPREVRDTWDVMETFEGTIEIKRPRFLAGNAEELNLTRTVLTTIGGITRWTGRLVRGFGSTITPPER